MIRVDVITTQLCACFCGYWGSLKKNGLAFEPAAARRYFAARRIKPKPYERRGQPSLCSDPMNSVETAINTVLQMANYINLYRVTDFDAFCDFSNFV